MLVGYSWSSIVVGGGTISPVGWWTTRPGRGLSSDIKLVFTSNLDGKTILVGILCYGITFNETVIVVAPIGWLIRETPTSFWHPHESIQKDVLLCSERLVSIVGLLCLKLLGLGPTILESPRCLCITWNLARIIFMAGSRCPLPSSFSIVKASLPSYQFFKWYIIIYIDMKYNQNKWKWSL